MKNYVEREIEKMYNGTNRFGYSIQVVNNATGEKTNYMKIDNDCIKAISNFLECLKDEY